MPPDSAETDINVLTVRSTGISTAMIMKDQPMVRKTKIVCTMGPKCWDEETMAELIDAGMGVARFNFSHGDHEAHQGVLDRFRKVCKEKESDCAVLLDTKGPEVRTAMLRNHEPIQLEKGQEIIVYAAGPDEYTTFEGYKTDEETKIMLVRQAVPVGEAGQQAAVRGRVPVHRGARDSRRPEPEGQGAQRQEARRAQERQPARRQGGA